MTAIRPWMLALAAVVLAGCANSGTGVVPPQTVKTVDLQRYQGTWYEVARLPMFFQRNCAQSEAHYALQEDGSMAVSNRCLTREGDWTQVQGRAVPQVEGQTDKLWVTFDNGFSRLLPGVSKGEYWVLELDDDYQVALVGHPNRKYLWLLSRTPQIADEVRDELLTVARRQGYDTDELIWREGANRRAERSLLGRDCAFPPHQAASGYVPMVGCGGLLQGRPSDRMRLYPPYDPRQSSVGWVK
ncbi:hypothetical protein DNK34_19520, partial [Pseudomonas dryadis]